MYDGQVICVFSLISSMWMRYSHFGGESEPHTHGIYGTFFFGNGMTMLKILAGMCTSRKAKNYTIWLHLFQLSPGPPCTWLFSHGTHARGHAWVRRDGFSKMVTFSLTSLSSNQFPCHAGSRQISQTSFLCESLHHHLEQHSRKGNCLQSL